MKLKCTKVLAKELNQKSNYTISCVKLNETQYKWYVDIDIFNHDNDYNYSDNTYNAIMVQYPGNYYACNKYITTNELLRIYKKIVGDKTLDNFAKAFNEYVEV